MGILSGILGAVAGPVGGFLLGGPLGSIIGGALGAGIQGHSAEQAQQDINNQNVGLAREQMAFQEKQQGIAHAFSAQQIADQREYETSMSNSSYQRGIADLQAAGLNPMLAYQQGGASTPSSPSPQGVTGGPGARAELHAPGLAAINTAFTAARLEGELEKMKAETDLTRASIPRVEQETRTSTSSAAELDSRTKERLARLQDLLPEEIKLSKAQQFEALERGGLHISQMDLLAHQVRTEIEKRGSEISFQNYNAIKILLDELRVPHEINRRDAESTWWKRNIAPYLEDVQRGTGSASDLFRMTPGGRTFYRGR